jgi:hypothetical protein
LGGNLATTLIERHSRAVFSPPDETCTPHAMMLIGIDPHRSMLNGDSHQRSNPKAVPRWPDGN